MKLDHLKNKKIICFDGVCALCNNFILFVAKNDTKDCFRFISLQNPKIKMFINSDDIKISSSIILISNRDIKIKSDAVLFILKELRFPISALIILNFIPIKIRNILYSIVAENRYHFFGKIDSCSILNRKKNKTILSNKII